MKNHEAFTGSGLDNFDGPCSFNNNLFCPHRYEIILFTFALRPWFVMSEATLLRWSQKMNIQSLV